MTYSELQNEVNNLLELNHLKEHGDFVFAGYLGDVSIDFCANIHIGHIPHFATALEKLADWESSPIEDDGYTGIQVFDFDNASSFKLEMGDLIDQKDTIVSFLITKRVDVDQANSIFNKLEKLHELGFTSINLINDHFQKEWYEKEQKEKSEQEEEFSI